MSPRGDDSGPGTITAPFETLARAMRALAPGDTLLVRGGIYVESLVIDSSSGYASGTAGAPITVRAHPGERPVLRAEPLGERIALKMGPDLTMGHWEFEGITIGGGSTRIGILLSGVHAVGISGCEWEDTLDEGARGIVMADGSRDIRLTHCRFDPPGAEPVAIERGERAMTHDDAIEAPGGRDHHEARAADGSRMMVVGPDAVEAGERVIVEVRVEKIRDAAHFPLRIAFDPEVLELEEASPGEFAGSDGSPTLFMAAEDGSPGIVKLALSRLPPAAGISGEGVLCRLAFRAAAPGQTWIITTGSALLDAAARKIEMRRDDAHVSVR